MSSAEPTWKALVVRAIDLSGSQDEFKRYAHILKRLVQRFGASDTERMLLGAKLLGWRSGLKGLATQDGIGRRWALEAFWQREKRAPAGKTLEAVGHVLQAKGLVNK